MLGVEDGNADSVGLSDETFDGLILGLKDGNADSVGLSDETFDGSILGLKDGKNLDGVPDDTFDGPILGMEDGKNLDGIPDDTFDGTILGMEDGKNLDGIPDDTFDGPRVINACGESNPDSPETTPVGNLLGFIIGSIGVLDSFSDDTIGEALIGKSDGNPIDEGFMDGIFNDDEIGSTEGWAIRLGVDEGACDGYLISIINASSGMHFPQ
jgi:hypothetical protein